VPGSRQASTRARFSATSSRTVSRRRPFGRRLSTEPRTVPRRGFRHVARLRKEVIQPHLPVRLPCYDFTPLTRHTFGSALPCGLSN
jgi:hypothetical protein